MPAMLMPPIREEWPTALECAAATKLRSLIYVSSATRAFTSGELAALVRRARVWNAANFITGTLLYRAGNFIQYLEGPADRLDALHRRIRRDPRHFGIITILDHRTDERAFAYQPLAFQDLDMAGSACDLGGEYAARAPVPCPGSVAMRILDRFRQHRQLRPVWRLMAAHD